MYKVPHHTIEELYWRDVRPNADCWGWDGQLHTAGYGVLRSGTKRVFAHRFAYEYFVGQLTPGQQAQSVCGRPSCTNPYHLDGITPSDRARRTYWSTTQRMARIDEMSARQLLRPLARPDLGLPNLQIRFWDRIDRSGLCWPWLGGVTTAGYGLVQFDGIKWYAHRLAYHLLVGPIPEGMQIDHLCRNRRCCNPAHFQLLSIKDHGYRSALARGA